MGFFLKKKKKIIKRIYITCCMKTVRWVWRRTMIMILVRRIRRTTITIIMMRRRIEHPGPAPRAAAAAALARSSVNLRSARPAIVSRGSGGSGAAPPAYEEAVGVRAAALEQNDVAGVEALLLDVAAPPFGEDVTLAAVPVGVAEAPGLTRLVLETQQEP